MIFFYTTAMNTLTNNSVIPNILNVFYQLSRGYWTVVCSEAVVPRFAKANQNHLLTQMCKQKTSDIPELRERTSQLCQLIKLNEIWNQLGILKSCLSHWWNVLSAALSIVDVVFPSYILQENGIHSLLLQWYKLVKHQFGPYNIV